VTVEIDQIGQRALRFKGASRGATSGCRVAVPLSDQGKLQKILPVGALCCRTAACSLAVSRAASFSQNSPARFGSTDRNRRAKHFLLSARRGQALRLLAVCASGYGSVSRLRCVIGPHGGRRRAEYSTDLRALSQPYQQPKVSGRGVTARVSSG